MAQPCRERSQNTDTKIDPPRPRGRLPLPDAGLVTAIQTLISDLPTYGYRRVHALLHRQPEREGRPART